MNRVTIRTKKKSKGTMLSVFLEYNPAFGSPKPPIFDNLLTFSNDYSHYFGEVTN